MKRIIVLEPNIANKIAAGEVVERPASIVKELIENALDSGATAITVEFRGGGVDYIRITDNGSGIIDEDVERAFMRHATSKLATAADLECINSFGFRGEALASIAAVSKVVMRTRTADSDYGTLLRIDGGKVITHEPCACTLGTSIEVSDLFYNVPARLKFIKSQRAEAAMITDYVSRIMLANPDISIKLINTGSTVLHSYGDGVLSNTIFSVYGSSVFASLYKVDYDDGYIGISGYVGGELIARSNRLQQSCFVNHRYIKSSLISNAVQRAFLTRLMNHRFPFFVLDILISGREIDVNVHPNKLSIRFSNESRVVSAVAKAIGDALKSEPVKHVDKLLSTHIQSERTESTSAPKAAALAEMDKSSSDYVAYTPVHKKPVISEIETEVRDIFSSANSVNCSDNISEKTNSDITPSNLLLHDSVAETFPAFTPDYGKNRLRIDSAKQSTYEQGADKIPVYSVSDKSENKVNVPAPQQIELDTDQARIIGAAFDSYVIVQQGDSVYFIDQHAAHERILYERLISGSMKFDSQILALPLTLRLDPVSYDCVVRYTERFAEFGYVLECNGGVITVYEVPSIVNTSAERFLLDAIDALMDYSDTAEVDLIRERIIKLSCKRAVKAGDMLEVRQYKAIVDAYATGEVPMTCPHGRPVIVKISKTDLEKMFKRIV
ncbi:MAG: DNA mismatch repair endonuclease MutL [Clostridia bacterium]|nr:DNA mismatch repair endonuclease MutL [Clostridia bacterium]